MTTTTAMRQRGRLRKLLEYIDRHLNEALSLSRLSREALLSKHHFQRRFAELFGMSAFRYVQLRRLNRASHQLAFRAQSPIMEIALANGYESPEAFCRAFKKCIGQSPTAFRRLPRWNSWHDIFQPLRAMRSYQMNASIPAEPVTIAKFPETRVAVLEHRGDPRLIGESLRQFIAWRRRNRLPPRVSATFNILYDDPDAVAPTSYRMDLCAATDMEIADNPQGIISKTIPGGRCAVLRHIGSDHLLRHTVHYLYREWLPQSGEAMRDFPVYLQRVQFFPDVPEHEAVTDVFLPLK